MITVYPVKSSSVPSGTGVSAGDVGASSSAPAPYGTGISAANVKDTCEPKTVTETATETVTVTATPSASASGNVVKPVSLSSSVYYPTGSSSVVHNLPSSGFLTKAKPTGYSSVKPVTPVGTAAASTKSILLYTGSASDSYAIPTEFQYAPEAAPTTSAAAVAPAAY